MPVNCTVSPVSGCAGDQVKAAPAGGVQETVVVSTAVAVTVGSAHDVTSTVVTSTAPADAVTGTATSTVTTAVAWGARLGAMSAVPPPASLAHPWELVSVTV